MLWLSAKELGEILTFIALRWSKILLHLASELEVTIPGMIVIILISPVNASPVHVWCSGCLAQTSAQGSAMNSTAVANVQVSMDEKVSVNLHGTTRCLFDVFALWSVAVDEAQCCASCDDEVLLKTDAGPVQWPLHGHHREVSVEFNRILRSEEAPPRTASHLWRSRVRARWFRWEGWMRQKRWTSRGWRTKRDWYRIRICEHSCWDVPWKSKIRRLVSDFLLQSPKEHPLTPCNTIATVSSRHTVSPQTNYTYMHTRVSHAASSPGKSLESRFCDSCNFSKALAPTIRSHVAPLQNHELGGDLPRRQSQIEENEKWKLSQNVISSSLHANSPRHNLSLEISGERRGSGAVQLVQLQLLSFCKAPGRQGFNGETARRRVACEAKR